MRLLITPDGKLLNLDLIISFGFDIGYIVAYTINNKEYRLFHIKNESSAKSWILNDLVRLINDNEGILDLRKIVVNS